MTVGVPGAGIGGLFYVISALLMPFKELRLLRQGRSSRASRRMVFRHFMIALAILGSMWIAAWLLALTLTTHTGVGRFLQVQSETAKNIPYFLSFSTLVAGAVTLILILSGVHILRMIVTGRLRGVRIVRRLSLILLWGMIVPWSATSQAVTAELADDAFRRNDTVTAEEGYRAIIERDVYDSHATFRLAQLLEKRDPRESEKLYRRYIELEPDDPWGILALAEFLEDEGRDADALREYRVVARTFPGEHGAVCGYGRLLARTGHTDEAIEVYEHWLGSRPDDRAAWLDLARERQKAGRLDGATEAMVRANELSSDPATVERLAFLRAQAGPAVEPTFINVGDSDGNSAMGLTLSGDISLSGTARLGVGVTRMTVSDPADQQSFSRLKMLLNWQPRASILVEAAVAAVFVDGSSPVTERALPGYFAGGVRMRARVPGDKMRFDVRLDRHLLDATPLLLRNTVSRSEIQIRPDLALSSTLRLRGTAKAASIEGGGESNTRHHLGGGIALSVAPGVEISGNAARILYARPSQAGYFAPAEVQSIELGSYAEFENGVLLAAFDVGAGLERIRLHGSRFGSWKMALRGYALAAYRLSPGRELRLELEGYDTRAGAIAVPTAGWKYGSLSLSLRWALGN